jgi:hypothetical protein
MVRTQIYLDPVHKRKLGQISRRSKVKVSELIRRSVEQFLGKSPSGPEEALGKTFGLWDKRVDLRCTCIDVRKLRREWENRIERTPAQVLLELSGSWDDDRTSEEILGEIRRGRRNSKGVGGKNQISAKKI